MPSADRDSLILLLHWLELLALTTLSKSSESGNPCLLFNLSGEALSLSPLSTMIIVEFLQMFFIKLRKFP